LPLVPKALIQQLSPAHVVSGSGTQLHRTVWQLQGACKIVPAGHVVVHVPLFINTGKLEVTGATVMYVAVVVLPAMH
jgi:hypothetical protein